MILLESLYRLLSADDQTRLLDPRFIQETAALAGLLVSAQHQIPAGERKAVLLTHVHGRFIPGGAQFITTATLRLVNIALAVECILAMRVVALGGGVQDVLHWQGEALLLPGWQIQATASFNAGAVNNGVNLQAHGVQIPLGNIERV